LKGVRIIAIYHCSIKIISRGRGRSAVAAAAYRAGEKIINKYDGQIHDYTRRGGIVHTEIMLPGQVPVKYKNRSVLWNAVEEKEGNRNSQLAREVQLALPVELSMEQNTSLVREYVQKYFVAKGMCADICIHSTGDGNPHAHIMLTMRPIEMDGSWGAKSKKEYILDDNGERIRLPSGEYKSRKIYTVDWNNKCFDVVMNGKTKLLVRAWQAEHKDLLAKRYGLCEEYYNLKDEVQSVEVLRRGIEKLLQEESAMAPPKIIQNKEYNS
jgi:hypothetical protein